MESENNEPTHYSVTWNFHKNPDEVFLNLSDSSTKKSGYKNKIPDTGLEHGAHFAGGMLLLKNSPHYKLVVPDYQEWFINNFPQLIPRIKDLDPKLRDKHSHLVMMDRFGVLKDD